MKQVICLIGSLRKDSIHRVLFGKYKTLAKESCHLYEGDISQLPLYDQDDEGKIKAAKDLATQILEADGIIFFTPEYNYSVPGPLKNAIDWVSRDDRKPFNNKKATIVGASPGSVGTARMQYHLRQIAVALNIHFLNKPEVMISNAYRKNKRGRSKR